MRHKASVYSRKSKFTGKGESIENQIELCKDYIFKNVYGAKDGDIYISDPIDVDKDGNSLTLLDVMAEEQDIVARYPVTFLL